MSQKVSSNSQSLSFLDMPLDAVDNTFNFLTCRNLARTQLVCKKWNAAVQHAVVGIKNEVLKSFQTLNDFFTPKNSPSKPSSRQALNEKGAELTSLRKLNDFVLSSKISFGRSLVAGHLENLNHVDQTAIAAIPKPRYFENIGEIFQECARLFPEDPLFVPMERADVMYQRWSQREEQRSRFISKLQEDPDNVEFAMMVCGTETQERGNLKLGVKRILDSLVEKSNYAKAFSLVSHFPTQSHGNDWNSNAACYAISHALWLNGQPREKQLEIAGEHITHDGLPVWKILMDQAGRYAYHLGDCWNNDTLRSVNQSFQQPEELSESEEEPDVQDFLSNPENPEIEPEESAVSEELPSNDLVSSDSGSANSSQKEDLPE